MAKLTDRLFNNRVWSVFTFIFIVLMLLVYFWQHDKVDNSDKKLTQLASQKIVLNKQITNLGNTVSTLQSKLKANSASPPLYKVGSTQCIKAFCITLDNDYTQPVSNDPGGQYNGYNLLFVELTVTNNGPVPTSHTPYSPVSSEMGIPEASMVYTSDNLFSGPIGADLGVLGMQCGTVQRFGNDIYGYPQQGKTVTGYLCFVVPPKITADSYLYGNLTWVL